jgi:hypothetical protein
VRCSERIKEKGKWVFVDQVARSNDEPLPSLETHNTASPIEQMSTEYEEMQVGEQTIDSHNSESQAVPSQANVIGSQCETPSVLLENQLVPNSDGVSSVYSQSLASNYCPSLVKTGQVSFVIPGMKAVGASQGSCMVCGDKKGRSRVTIEARVDIWIRKRIFIPLGNRCCKHHLSDGIFKEEALNLIKPGPSALMTGQMVATWISTLTEVFSKPRMILDFEGGSPLTNDHYEMLLGVSRENFDTILELCQKSIKRSRNR